MAIQFRQEWSFSEIITDSCLQKNSSTAINLPYNSMSGAYSTLSGHSVECRMYDILRHEYD